MKLNLILIILSISILTTFITCALFYKAPSEPLVMPEINTSDIASPVIVSEGYLVKSTDVYGRENWQIGAQSIKSTDIFCILSDKNSPSFLDDIFSRNPVSMLRTDQLYKLYSCKFRQYSSDKPDGRVETVWGIQAVSDNVTIGSKERLNE